MVQTPDLPNAGEPPGHQLPYVTVQGFSSIQSSEFGPILSINVSTDH